MKTQQYRNRLRTNLSDKTLKQLSLMCWWKGSISMKDNPYKSCYDKCDGRNKDCADYRTFQDYMDSVEEMR